MIDYEHNSPKYYNKEVFKDIQNKEYIHTDSKTAFEISKEAQKYGIEHSVKYDKDKSIVTVDGVKDKAFAEAVRAEFNIAENSRPEKQTEKPAYFGRSDQQQTKEDSVKYYNREGFKDIQNKEYIHTDSKTAFEISKEAQKYGIEHSVKYDKDKSIVTVDGVKDKAFAEAVRAEFNIAENSRPEKQTEKPAYFGRSDQQQTKEDGVKYYNREGFKDIQNKTYIQTDSKTAFSISKEAQKYGIEHSVKYNGEKSTVTVDGIKNKDFIDAVKNMSDWAVKVQEKAVREQSRGNVR